AVPQAEYRRWIEDRKRAAASGCPDDPTPRQIAAKDTASDKDCPAAKVDQPFNLEFDNQDAVDHNVSVYKTEAAADVLFQGAIFKGPKTETYNIKPMPKGNYFF